MEQLDLLWEFQDIDLKRDAVINESKRTQNTLKLLKLKKFMVDKQNKLIELDREATRKNEQFNDLKEVCRLISNEVSKNSERLENVQDLTLKQIEQLETKCFQVKNRLKKTSDEVNAILRLIDKLYDEAYKITLEIKKAKQEYASIKQDYDVEQQSYTKQADEIKVRRDKIGSQINGELLKKYNNLKINHSTAIAKINNSRCGGCNMSLAALVIQNVKNQKKIIECENCGRILYVES